MNYRGRRSTLALQVGLVTTTLLVSCGRPREDGDEASIDVRDSLGITIVENRTPPIATWRLSQAPLIAVGSDGPVEQSPLDPPAVFFGADGHIIVGDGNQVGWDAVLVYDADGDFIMKMGGRGEARGSSAGSFGGPAPTAETPSWHGIGGDHPDPLSKSSVRMGDSRATCRSQGS